VAPEPEAINRQDMAPGHDLAEAIAQAKRLQRVARHWRSDPCWPPVRDVIERYLPQLTIDAESDVGSEYLLRVVRQLLGHS